MAENARTASARNWVCVQKISLRWYLHLSCAKVRADEAYALVRKAMNAFKIYGMDLLEHITKDPRQNVLLIVTCMFSRLIDVVNIALLLGMLAKFQVNLFNVPGLDGRKLVADAFALPEKGGWVDYAIENPLLNRIEVKTSYIERISDDIVLGCGVYKSV